MSRKSRFSGVDDAVRPANEPIEPRLSTARTRLGVQVARLGSVSGSKRVLGLDLGSAEQSRSTLSLVSTDTEPSIRSARFGLFCSGITIYKHKP